MDYRITFEVDELDCKGSFCFKEHSTKWMTLQECLSHSAMKEESAKLIKRANNG